MEKLTKEIKDYLTQRFIGNPNDCPDNECLSEAEYILTLVKAHYEPQIEEAKKQERERILKFFELHQGASEPTMDTIPVFGGKSRRACSLKTTKMGQPQHPLYLPKTLRPLAKVSK